MNRLALLLFAAPLFGQTIRIDHVTIAGADLNAMRAAFTQYTGITPEYGGPHSNHATEMALVSFPDGSYLELMGIQKNPDPAAVTAHVWGKFLRDNAGPCAFAIGVPDVPAEIARLKSTGIATGAAERSGRMRQDGVRLDWETANVGPGARGSLFPFLIRDFTPREPRAWPSGKPTAHSIPGVAMVIIGVSDLESAIAQYRRAYSLPAPRRQTDQQFAADLAWFDGTPVVLARGMSGSWLAQRVAKYGDAPAAFVLSGGAFGSRSSNWFGQTIRWADEKKVGWKLGSRQP